MWGGGQRNTIVGNNIMENWGRGIYVGNSFNMFVENNIMNNNEGVYIYSYGQNNLFFHNNFSDNTKHVNYYWSGIGNSWNSSFPVGGNYWSGYEDKYPTAMELDNSGLWDTPHVINENNVDYYPLMSPTKPITRKFTAYTHHMFYVTYTHSEHMIEVVSTEVVPEFSHAVIPLLLMSITILAAALTKKRIFGRQNF
jgi:parallel beta-helix repeat protein